MRLGDQIVADVERRYAEAVGGKTYAEFRDVMRGMVEPRPIRPLR